MLSRLGICLCGWVPYISQVACSVVWIRQVKMSWHGLDRHLLNAQVD